MRKQLIKGTFYMTPPQVQADVDALSIGTRTYLLEKSQELCLPHSSQKSCYNPDRWLRLLQV
jgi:hypothetical protein